jgi:malonyl-CoA O-methyltransferase
MKSRIQHDFGKAAPLYDSHAVLQREVACHLFGLSSHMLQDNTRILDAGCGTGYFHELARSHQFYGDIVQLDLAFPMCQLAALYASAPPYGRSYTITGDSESLPLANSTCNGVFSSLMMQWTDINSCSREFKRVLTPGGTLALSSFGTRTLHELATAFSAIDTMPHVNSFIPHSALITALEEAGFRHITFEQEIKTVYYDSVLSLMRGLKYIGATHKTASPRKSLYGKGLLYSLEAAYSKEAEGVPSTWDIYYIVATA